MHKLHCIKYLILTLAAFSVIVISLSNNLDSQQGGENFTQRDDVKHSFTSPQHKDKRPVPPLTVRAKRSTEPNTTFKETPSVSLGIRNAEIATLFKLDTPLQLDLPFNASQVLNLQKHRKNKINQVCAEHVAKRKEDSQENELIGHGNCYSLANNSIMMCRMPKTGSKDMLRLLCGSLGPKCAPGIFTHLKLEPEENMLDSQYFGKYFSFNTVRNPWTRLVSAFTHKFLNSYDFIYMAAADKCFDRHKKLTARHIRWTFQRFLDDCVIYSWERKGAENMDEHWRPQSLLGSFCTMNYTYINKFETAQLDRTALLYRFGVRQGFDKIMADSSANREKFEKHNTTANTYSKLWSETSTATIDKLKVIYDLDIRLFDYPAEPL